LSYHLFSQVNSISDLLQLPAKFFSNMVANNLRISDLSDAKQVLLIKSFPT
jgi:hypothetical protein